MRGTAVSRTTLTAAGGTWSFGNVLPGTYQLDETQPATYADGIDTAGSLGGSTAVNDRISAIAVTDANGTGYNFGELSATISGRVWRDVNRNGTLEAGEVGIAGVTLTLTGTDTLGNAVSRTVTTDASGNYSFTGLPAGTYAVAETQPAGFGSSTPNTISGLVLPAAGTLTGNDFGDTSSALAGTVFFDRNANGANDGSDTPIAGVVLTLTGTDAAGAAVNTTATTDAGGAFSFNDIKAPNGAGYTLTETQPTAYRNGAITAGSAGGTVTLAANRVSAIALPVGTSATGYLFAELGTPISGTVYRDANRNGAKDTGEPGIAGVTITLRDAGNTVIATTTTAADGTYAFPDQPAGSYTIVETQPTGYSSGPQNAGNSLAIALVAGTPAVVDFGESTASLAGTVFLDGNNNGVQDGGEIGLTGVTLTLTGTDSLGAAVNRTLVTGAGGTYLFADLLGGTYAIAETQPAVFGDGLEVAGAGNVGGTIGNDLYSAIALPAGSQATGYNFAETGSAVTGVVYRDANRNGTQQPGDTGIAGVTVSLRDAGNTVVATTVTAADGSYLFAGVPAGNYTVVETQPAGYGSSATSPDSVAVVVPVAGAATANFADTLSTLAGSVYVDLNGNGARDAGEPGISAVTVRLAGTDAAGAVVNRTAATDATGNFLFVDVLTPSGAGYTLSEPTQPAGWADGLDAAGSAGGAVANDSISAIALAVNTDATGYTFGELGSSIHGVVFRDVSGNASREAGEPGIAGVTLTLRDGLGNVIATTTTASDGSYAFTGVPAGNYTVVETQPAGFGSSSPDSVAVTVPAGGSGVADFADTTSGIAGFVWADTNNNAARDAGEPGIGNVTVTLTGTDAGGATVNRTVQSAADGSFRFADILAGTYSLTETQPAAYADGQDVAGSAGGTVGNDTITAIALPAGTQATGYGFGERGQSLSGRIWIDRDRDGVIDAGELPIAGVVVTLLDESGVVVATTTTAADGSYGFANIPSGRYRVVETQPAGYGSSTPDSVIVDVTNTGAPPVVNFGDTAGSFAGLVYDDASNDGQWQAGEPPIPGVTLRLTGTDARGTAVSRQVTTGADGRYLFTDVAAGSYTLAEVQPEGYQDGQDRVGSAGGTLANDQVSAIALGVAVDATGYDFGERGAEASLAGHVWRDDNHDRIRGSGEPALAGWIVELLQAGTVQQSTSTDANGAYQFARLAPGGGYEVRFREPASRAVYGMPVTNEDGIAVVDSVLSASNPGAAATASGTIAKLVLPPAATLLAQSLPVDPSGVVYDSVSRRPVAGATVTLTGPQGFNPALHLVGGAGNATQITGDAGLYQFLLLPTAPAGNYTLSVTPPVGRFTPGLSSLIPPCANVLTVGAQPAPALVQNGSTAPAGSVANVDAAQCAATSLAAVPTRGTTQYWLRFALTPGTSANVINNHVPVDPILAGALRATKTTPSVNVAVGDLVPYTITITNTLNATLTNIDVRDFTPPGFAYRAGTASRDGIAAEPQRVGRELTWLDQVFAPNQSHTYKLVLVVGAGVGEAEYVNQAWGLNNIIDTAVSNVATAAVRVVPDPVFDCTDIVGKVFDDRNANGYQDAGEPGVPHVRLATVNGVLVSTDADGRYHVACAAVPDAYRGSNFVMKLDERTLPAGYRVTTENPRAIRITRGKLATLNFGATIHRVVRVEVSDAAFDAGSLQLKADWKARVSALVRTLEERPTVVRVAYGQGADAALAKRRTRELVSEIRKQWEALHCCYALSVEDEAGARQ
ncbi:MAG: SdrD B-like domain-containing protein [Steroidobacteraceae bacterium]